VSCNRVRRELLEHFRFPQELGSRSGPHLAHLESCAACREEVGINRELVEQLRRALRERVEGSDPSAASWDLVRRRTVDRPAQPWTMRVLRWGGVLPAAFAGILMFASISETGLLDRSHSPVSATAPSVQVAALEQANGSEPPLWSKYRAERAVQPVSPSTDSTSTIGGEMPPIIRRVP
jgi:anti-sigma factor RsiW